MIYDQVLFTAGRREVVVGSERLVATGMGGVTVKEAISSKAVRSTV